MVIDGQPPTLYDVAREAGVSLATASRVLNGSERVVRPEYRERVETAAARLGYRANRSAQAVARGASASVALLVSDIDDPYFSAIASGAIAAADRRDLIVTIAVTGRDARRELAVLRSLRGQRPQAIVLAGSRSTADPVHHELATELASYASAGGRAVLIGPHDLPYPSVRLDPAGAGELAGALVGRGYRGFAILAGPDRLVTARERVASFTTALDAAGLRPKAVIHGGFDRDGGRAAAQRLDVRGVDVVWAVNDVMAIGAAAALRARGVAVPDEVAIAGYDDIHLAADMVPSLSTVALPIEDAGATAIELAFGDDPSAMVTLASSVVLRESTPAR